MLEAEKFERLKGRKVGLVTNHTGRDRQGRATADVLHAADGMKLVALFSPEHGIRGELDERTSPTARTRRPACRFTASTASGASPTPETLKGIDTLVYDIQDVGCRFYTYISTLGNVLEAAAEHKVKVVVLDRPNPIGGVAVDGPAARRRAASRSSPTTRCRVRHGMTVGELARLFVAERKLDGRPGRGQVRGLAARRPVRPDGPAPGSTRRRTCAA